MRWSFFSKPKERIIVGLEIGTSKICVAVCASKVGVPLRILTVGSTPSRGVRKGEIINPITAAACIREALGDAEEKADVEIRNIYLAVTGGHINGFNNRGCVNLPQDRHEIDEVDCEDVAMSARDLNIPPGNIILHAILQKYRVDERDGVIAPVGMIGSRLEADFHIVQAASNRVKNGIRCVKEIGLEVEDVVFSGLASAQVVLTPHQKEVGALLLDMGGGTTDFILYQNGAVHQCGVLPIGGDHITSDIARGFDITNGEAERLKVAEGSALEVSDNPHEQITVSTQGPFVGKTIKRENLYSVISLRVQETLELIADGVSHHHDLSTLSAGIFLTGGASQLHGITEMAGKIFGLPVHCSPWANGTPAGSWAEKPEFSTALGVVKYADVIMPK